MIIDDKKLLRREIDRLEKSLIAISENILFVNCDEHPFYEVYKIVKTQLNAAKFDYETNFGKANWKLNAKELNYIK